jgi:hypothetical protein
MLTEEFHQTRNLHCCGPSLSKNNIIAYCCVCNIITYYFKIIVTQMSKEGPPMMPPVLVTQMSKEGPPMMPPVPPGFAPPADKPLVIILLLVKCFLRTPRI